MSRLEKTIQKKSKGRKRRFISKVLFILFMIVNLMVCIFIVDNSAKMMLGEQAYKVEPVIKEIQTFINEKIIDISSTTKEILAKFNK
jgi:glycopeptide antibiotics resistance protein